jgi:hypothetical protein
MKSFVFTQFFKTFPTAGNLEVLHHDVQESLPWDCVNAQSDGSWSHCTHSHTISLRYALVLPSHHLCQGYRNFPKIYTPPPQNFRHQKRDTRQFPHWGHTNIRYHDIKFSCLEFIHPLCMLCPKQSTHFRFPNQNVMYICDFLHACHMSCPCHSSWLNYHNNISPLFCKKGLTATFSKIELRIAGHSTNDPLWYGRRWQLPLQK